MCALKNAKGIEFLYEHCWVFVRDFPKWTNGSVSVKEVTPSKHRVSLSMVNFGDIVCESASVVERDVEDQNSVLWDCLSGIKSGQGYPEECKDLGRSCIEASGGHGCFGRSSNCKECDLDRWQCLTLDDDVGLTDIGSNCTEVHQHVKRK